MSPKFTSGIEGLCSTHFLGLWKFQSFSVSVLSFLVGLNDSLYCAAASVSSFLSVSASNGLLSRVISCFLSVSASLGLLPSPREHQPNDFKTPSHRTFIYKTLSTTPTRNDVLAKLSFSGNLSHQTLNTTSTLNDCSRKALLLRGPLFTNTQQNTHSVRT